MIEVNARLGSRRPSDKLRRDVLTAMDRAVSAAQPGNIIRKHLRLDGEMLRANGLGFSLKKHGRILVIGAGKASGHMAEEVEKMLGKQISGGLVIIPEYLKSRPKGHRLNYHLATHPLPTQKGVRGVVSMLDLVKNVSSTDLVI